MYLNMYLVPTEQPFWLWSLISGRETEWTHKSHLAIAISKFGQRVVLYCHLLRGCLIPCLTSPWWTAGAPQASGRCLHETCQMSTSCLAGSSGPGISDMHRCIKRTIHSVLSTKAAWKMSPLHVVHYRRRTTLHNSIDNVQKGTH